MSFLTKDDSRINSTHPHTLRFRCQVHPAQSTPAGHDREDLAVVVGQRALVGRVAAVRDEQDCPPGHLRRYRSDSRGVGEGLLGQTVQHPLRDRQFIPLGMDLLELLGQLFVEGVQFAPAAGDPLSLLHPRALPRSHGVSTC